MSPGTKVFLAVFGLLIGALVLYYATISDERPDQVRVQNPQTSIADPLHQPETRRPETPLGRSVAEAASAGQAGPGSLAANRPAENDTPRRSPFTAGLADGRSDLEPLTNTTTFSPAAPDPEESTKPQPVTAAPPPTVEYVVKPNETMSSIARDWFGKASLWRLIAEENPFVDPDRINEGDVLRLPMPPAATATAAPAPGRAPGPGTYTVKGGDTLSTIAQKVLGSAADWRRLYDANRAMIGRDPDDLRLGMVLVIPR